MKHFLIYTTKILATIIVVLLLSDILYTYIYSKSKNRNKVEFVVNSNARKYDLVILGSSRANNHFDADLFNSKGIKTFNFGMSGARLSENALLLQLMVERNYSIKNILLEADLTLNSESESEGTKALFLPYIHNSETINNFYKHLSNYNQLFYIPFYRYICYESEIGFRATFFAAIHKKSISLNNQGFYPLFGTEKNLAFDMSKYSPKKNKSYELIKQICSKNNINLIVVTTPICDKANSSKYFIDLKKLYPEIHNYEKVVTDDSYFSTCGHMNIKGAKVLTSKICKDFFNK